MIRRLAEQLNLRWQAVAAAEGTFSVHYPDDPDAGITLELSSGS